MPILPIYNFRQQFPNLYCILKMFQWLWLFNCTLSASIARPSLRPKNPDTGPVWWYLKTQKSQAIKKNNLEWVCCLVCVCDKNNKLTFSLVCHHNPSSWINVSYQKGRKEVLFSCWTSCGCWQRENELLGLVASGKNNVKSQENVTRLCH